MITLKKIMLVAKVLLSIIHQRFVGINEISTFLNAFWGTTTVTGEKVNKMLIEAGYQIFSEDVLVEDERIMTGYNEPTKYAPTKKAQNWYTVAESHFEDKEELYLKWRADLILKVLKIDFLENTEKNLELVISCDFKYSLVNHQKEFIDTKLLMKNLEYLKDSLEAGGVINEIL